MPTSCCGQTCVLIRRKDGLLKTSRCCASICEIMLPVCMCALLILGSASSDVEEYPNLLYAPQNMTDALATVSPLGFGKLITSHGVRQDRTLPGEIPGFVPSLPLWLSYSYVLRSYRPVPPYDGTFLAVTPDTPEVRQIVSTILDAPASTDKLTQMVLASPRCRSELATAMVGAGLCSSATTCDTSSLLTQARPAVDVRYFATQEAIEELAKEESPIWAALVIGPLPTHGVGNWIYTIRSNYTSPRFARRKYDRFPDGLSTLGFHYYQDGFLTLQQAINAYILERNSLASPLAYGIPLPIPAYSHNTFFDFAGNLIGLVVVFSYLVPLSTMLRTLVLEKEMRLKEELLMMGR